MNRIAVKADRIHRAARKFINSQDREAAVLAAQAESDDPGSQYFELAIDRAVGSRHSARSALIRVLPAILSMIDLGDVLVVVAPGEQADPPRPGRTWHMNDLQVLVLPHSAVLV